jgi:hypothetical protein
MAKLPPLISPSSPSYERARRELKDPTPTGDPVVVGLLGRLVEIEHGGVQTCLAAAAAVTDPDLARAIGEACGQHRDRLAALGALITDLGGAAPRLDESRELLRNGPEAIEAAGSDQATVEVLRAMRAEVAACYAEAARDPSLDDDRRAALAALGQ